MSAAANGTVIPFHAHISPEAAVLGAALTSTDIRTKVVVELDAGDFLRPGHQILFNALVDAHAAAEPAAVMTIAARLATITTPEGRVGLDAAGGMDYLQDLLGAAMPANIDYFLARVRGAGQRRLVGELGRSLAQAADTAGSDLASAAVKAVVGLERLLLVTDRWPDPIPLGADRLPPFPAGTLPGPLGRFAAAVAASTQTPLDLAALAGLGVLSAATRGRWKIQPAPDWSEHLALYVAALADSGARKSAVLEPMAEPFMAYERDLCQEGAAAYAEALDEYRIAKGRAEQALKLAIQADADRAEEAKRESHALTAAIAGIEEPAEPQLWFDDATVESMGSLLASQGGASAHLSDEGGLVSSLAGRYGGKNSSGPNLDLLLKAYDGKASRINRVGRGKANIERPFLAIAMVVQPDVVAQANAIVEMRERGLLPRFLFALPASNLGMRDLFGPPIPDNARSEWDGAIRRILDLSIIADTPVRLLLDSEADAIFTAFRAGYERRLYLDHGDLTDIVGWASKQPGRVARLAGLFALADDPHRTWVGGEHMRAAVDLVDYFVAHARAAMNLRRDPVSGTAGAPSTSPAEVLARWLLRQDVAALTVRDCWQAMKTHAWASSTADVRAALDRLEEHGWVRVEEPEGAPRRGRPTSPTVTVNPKIRLAAARGTK